MSAGFALWEHFNQAFVFHRKEPSNSLVAHNYALTRSAQVESFVLASPRDRMMTGRDYDIKITAHTTLLVSS